MLAPGLVSGMARSGKTAKGCRLFDKNGNQPDWHEPGLCRMELIRASQLMRRARGSDDALFLSSIQARQHGFRCLTGWCEMGADA